MWLNRLGPNFVLHNKNKLKIIHFEYNKAQIRKSLNVIQILNGELSSYSKHFVKVRLIKFVCFLNYFDAWTNVKKVSN